MKYKSYHKKIMEIIMQMITCHCTNGPAIILAVRGINFETQSKLAGAYYLI